MKVSSSPVASQLKFSLPELKAQLILEFCSIAVSVVDAVSSALT